MTQVPSHLQLETGPTRRVEYYLRFSGCEETGSKGLKVERAERRAGWHICRQTTAWFIIFLPNYQEARTDNGTAFCILQAASGHHADNGHAPAGATFAALV